MNASACEGQLGLRSRREAAKRTLLCAANGTPDSNQNMPGSGSGCGSIPCGEIFEDEDGLPLDDVAMQPTPLRFIIERLEGTLSDRLDLIESRLELLGEEIVRKVLCCGIFATASSREHAGMPAADGNQSLHKGHDASEPEKHTEPPVEVLMDSASSCSSETTSCSPFTLRPEWRTGRLHAHLERVSLPETSTGEMEGGASEAPGWEAAQKQRKPWYIVWPSGRVRTLWDLTTMLIIAQDMAFIPINLAFDTGLDNPTNNPLFWPLILFWTADMPLTFLTGLHQKGRVEVSLPKIASEYLRTWFFLDACMVGSAWSEYFIGSQTRGLALGRVGKTLRILRVMRSMRLLRLVKMRRIMEDFQAGVTSEYIHIIMSVLKLILIIVWTNHFIGCTWWAIGNSGPRQGDHDAQWSWTSHFEFQNDSIGYQYFTALHWSLTQFTPASMEVSPCNLGERMFAVLVLLFAMIVFSSFVSSITAAMTQLRQLSSSVDKSFIILRRYLRMHQTPVELNMRIVRCVEHRISARKNDISEGDVALLQYLSKPLQMELLYHIYSPRLEQHPFFKHLSEKDSVAMQRVCLGALTRVSLWTGDRLFSEACSGNQMFFVVSGRLRYYTSAGLQRRDSDATRKLSAASSVNDQRSVKFQMSDAPQDKMDLIELCEGAVMQEGDWFCESSLWCSWTHCGTMVAERMSEVLAVDATSFASVASQHRLAGRGAQRYSEAFVVKLNRQNEESTVNDIIQCPSDSLVEMAQNAFAKKAQGGLVSASASLLASSSMADLDHKLPATASTASREDSTVNINRVTL